MARHHRRPAHLCAPVVQWGSVPKCKHDKPMRAGDWSCDECGASNYARRQQCYICNHKPACKRRCGFDADKNSRAAKSDPETGSASHAAASAMLGEASASTATSLVTGSKRSSHSHPSCSGLETGSARNVATTITRAARGATAAVIADDAAGVAINGRAVCLQ